jgi:hypothetical protein
MKYFSHREIYEARAYAAKGGQALHVWKPGEAGKTWPGAPGVFKRNMTWAHLFDQDVERLQATARRLGVRVIAVQDRRTRDQHIDLCGKPLKRAIKETEQGELLP